MNIIKKHISVNFTDKVCKKKLICLHITAGDKVSSALNWFNNEKAKASANFVLDKNGDIYECVEPTKVAYANGIKQSEHKLSYNKIVLDDLTNPNEISISIEIVDTTGKTVTFAQYSALNELCKYLYENYIDKDVKEKYNIKDIITTHAEIDPTHKPYCAKYVDRESIFDYVLNNNSQVFDCDNINRKVNEKLGFVYFNDNPIYFPKEFNITQVIQNYRAKGRSGVYIEGFFKAPITTNIYDNKNNMLNISIAS